jgi:PAS domain S-box-containing protein
METKKQIDFRSSIIDYVSDAIFTFDKNLIITSWNKSAEKLYGWKAGEIIGRNSADILHTTITDEERTKLLNTVSREGELFAEAIHFTKSKKRIVVEAHVICMKDDNGEIINYLTVNRDITHRKQIEEQLRKEKERLEILADLAGVFANVTSEYQTALDYTVKSLADKIGDLCTIRLQTETKDRLIERAFYHPDKENLDFLTKLYSSNVYQSNESFSGYTLKTATPLLIPIIKDTSNMKPEYLSYMEKYGLSSLLFVPIVVEGYILGTISLYRNKPGNPYTSDDQHFLQNVAGKIGFAITKANLFMDKLNEIEERRLVERALIEQKDLLIKSESKYRQLAESITDVFFAMDKDFRFTYWNKASEKLTGIAASEAIGKSLFELFPISYETRPQEIYRKVMVTKMPESFTSEFVLNGENHVFEISVYPSREGISVFTKDITELNRIRAKNEATERRYQNILDNLDEGCAILDYDWNYIYVNPTNARHAHLTQEQMLGKNMLEVIPGVEKSIFFETYERCMKDRVPLNVESRFTFEDGSVHWYETRALPIPEGIFVLSIDITERKVIENKINSALKEKEVLLRELYHRTKNNMQVIYSLLGLKRATTEDERTRTILGDMGNRIQSIALVHQKLYQSNNLSRIDLKDYITDLTHLLMESYNPNEKDIILSLELESVMVLLDTAIPCGLIINELISNSFKHAFPEGRSGEIKVKLSRQENNIIVLNISDNGVGIPPMQEIQNNDTIGVQLFKNIAEDQLQGEVIFDTNNGVSCIVKFKDILYKERV